MVTTNTSTIGGTTPDYSTITLWEAATDNNMVTADTIEKGLCRAVTFDENVVIAGATTDATRYRWLTIDTGVQPAFKAGAGNGAIIDPSTNGHCIEIQEGYFWLDGLELTGTQGSSSEGCRIDVDSTTVFLSRCLIHGHSQTDGDGVYTSHTATNLTVQMWNCVLYDCTRAAIHPQLWHNSQAAVQTWNIWNCVVYNPGGEAGLGVRCGSAGHTLTITVKNCLLDDWAATGTGMNTNATVTFTSNNTICSNDPSVDIANVDTWNEDTITDSATFTTSTAASAVILTNLTAGSEDLHLVDHANNLAIGYGANLSGDFTDDADGDARPGAGAWDAGADELTAPPAALSPALMLKPAPIARRRFASRPAAKVWVDTATAPPVALSPALMTKPSVLARRSPRRRPASPAWAPEPPALAAPLHPALLVKPVARGRRSVSRPAFPAWTPEPVVPAPPLHPSLLRKPEGRTIRIRQRPAPKEWLRDDPSLPPLQMISCQGVSNDLGGVYTAAGETTEGLLNRVRVIRGPVTISPSGVESEGVVGAPSPIGFGLGPSGVADENEIGSPTVTTGAVTISPSGVASSNRHQSKVGNVVGVPPTRNLSPGGIASSSFVGRPILSGDGVGCLARRTYSGDGTTAAYAIGFPYLETEHVIASVDGVETTDVTVSGDTITFDDAPASGAVILILRRTPSDDPLVRFSDSSKLLASDIARVFTQCRYYAQEVADLVSC